MRLAGIKAPDIAGGTSACCVVVPGLFSPPLPVGEGGGEGSPRA